jgi:hypothetical protein
MIWKQGASYTSYTHGPLWHTVLGRDLVQGLDDTYTLAGCLMGINLPTLSTSDDSGKDGLATGSNPTVGRDSLGMQLHYYNGDFTDGRLAFAGTRSEASFKGLYNGNIVGWSYTSRSENGTPQTTMLSTYFYDNLNDLMQAWPHTMVSNVWTTSD